MTDQEFRKQQRRLIDERIWYVISRDREACLKNDAAMAELIKTRQWAEFNEMLDRAQAIHG